MRVQATQTLRHLPIAIHLTRRINNYATQYSLCGSHPPSTPAIVNDATSVADSSWLFGAYDIDILLSMKMLYSASEFVTLGPILTIKYPINSNLFASCGF